MSDMPGAGEFVYDGGPVSEPVPGWVDDDERVEADLEELLASVMADREAEGR